MILKFVNFFYKSFFSPIIHALFGGGAGGCRFEPTCSQHWVGSVKQWGWLKGSWLGLKQVSRCHPWGSL